MRRQRFRGARNSISITVWLRGPLFRVMAVLVGFVLLVQLVDFKLRPVLTLASQAIAKRAATEVLNAAVTEEIATETQKEPMVSILHDKGDDVEIASFNFPAVSRLQSAATAKAEEEIRALSDQTLALPLTQVLGGSLFAAIGPRLPVHLYMLGNVHSSVASEVKSAGINQAAHILYLDLSLEVNVVAPFVSAPVEVDTRVPVAYLVFVGKVPQTFVGSSSGTIRPSLPAQDESVH